MKRKLTDRFLDSINAPDAGRATYSDSVRPGLHIRVGPSKRSWMYEKRVHGGAKRKHSLGTWPTISLAEARAVALEIQAEAERGVDRIENAEIATLTAERDAADHKNVSDVLDKYEQLKLVNLRTGAERARELRKALHGHLNHPISNLSRLVLQDAIDAKLEAGRLVYANRIRSYLRAFTKWAYGRDYIAQDIGEKIDTPTKEEPRDRVLSLEEVRAIYHATFEIGPLWGPMFRLLVLTGQRRGEIAKLKWASVDLNGSQIALAGADTKNGKPHITHLSPSAHSELAVLFAKGPESGLVFTTTGKTPASGISKAKHNLDSILTGRVAHWRLHDLRRAMATYLAESGASEGVVDRIQNHSASSSAPSAVARVYQQSDLLPQRAAALDKWEDMVTRRNAEIVRLARK